MAFMDLSVKGKPSPRHERPFSGKRSGYRNQNVNTKANIFGISESTAGTQTKSSQVNSRVNSETSNEMNRRYRTPDAPRESGAPSIPSSVSVKEFHE